MPRFFALLFLLSLLWSVPPVAKAQVDGRSLGIGGQLGDPTGISIRYYTRPGTAYDFLAAFDINDELFLVNAHRLWDRPIPGASVDGAPLRYFYGPGLLVGTIAEDNEELTLGATFDAGLSVPLERFEAFVQLTPGLLLLPGTESYLGGGLGLRYYL